MEMGIRGPGVGGSGGGFEHLHNYSSFLIIISSGSQCYILSCFFIFSAKIPVFTCPVEGTLMDIKLRYDMIRPMIKSARKRIYASDLWL